MTFGIKNKEVRIEILYCDDCPNLGPTLSILEGLLKKIGLNVPVQKIKIENLKQAQQVSFLGSPSIRINGKDIEEGRDPKQISMSCRIFPNGKGVPDAWMLEAGLVKELKPQHILFLCVANSARSQMAEGIARHLAPSSVQISSAGSAPSKVNPLSIQVLKENGIDISSHYSKSVNEFDTSTVDLVITLCAEEVCPVFLGKAIRLHWGLSDPAPHGKSDADAIEKFREIRDEILKRLSFLLEGWES